MGIVHAAMGIVPRMGDDDKLPETPAGEERAIEGGTDVSHDWKKVFLHSRDRRPPDEAAAALSEMLTVRMGGILRQLENLGGISAYRIEAIVCDEEEPTNSELEEIGYACVELLRALKDE